MLDQLIAEIDKEIVRLQRARQLLTSSGGSGSVPSPRGKKAHKKRVVSAAARAKMAAAQRKRWAQVKRSAK